MEKINVKQTKWNLTPLFKGDNDPEMENKRKIVEQKSYEFINKWRDRDDYLKEPAILKEALDEYENWQRFYGADADREVYFWLRTEQDKNNAKLKARLNKVRNSSHKIQNDIQFFALKIARIPAQLQANFLAYEGLSDYKHFLEKLFAEAKYLLSEPEEKILNLKSVPAYLNWVNLTESFLAKEERKILLKTGKKQNKNFSEILSLTGDKNRKVRDSAAEALNDIFLKDIDIAEAEMNSILTDKKINDELRGMARPDLAMHIIDDIDSEVADSLAESVAARFDISRRYFRLKARLFGVKKLKYHERYVPYGEINKKYSYQEAADFVFDVFSKIDKDFAEIFRSFAENGQIDIYPAKGKAGGGFCFRHLLSQPTYILLNHTGNLKDVFDLAHEAGHGINNELMRRRQNALNFGTPLFTAEVASTFMEDFVLEELTKEAGNEERLAIMMTKLGDDVSAIFRQAACYRFESELHREIRSQGYLPKEKIGKMFQKHMAAYMGGAVKQSRGSENWWVYWGHIRRFFYVYSYVSGLLISKALQNSARKDREFIGKVKEFLSAGTSDSPKNIFRKMGIDISNKEFWNKGMDEVENLLNETEKLAKKLGKI